MNENRVLTIDNLTTTFKSHKQKIQAVRGVSLYVKEGDILAIVGESGSGKSRDTGRPSGAVKERFIIHVRERKRKNARKRHGYDFSRPYDSFESTEKNRRPYD